MERTRSIGALELRTMAESMSVRCPACGRRHRYTAPVFPCACGTPLALPLQPTGMPVPVRHRSWNDSWVGMRCPDCGRRDEWPQPEYGCHCGETLRLPVDNRALAESGAPTAPRSAPVVPVVALPPDQPAPHPRPPFRPVTIRTTRDALTAAAQYLKWLGFASVRIAGHGTAHGIDLRGEGIVAQVDPSTQRTRLRDVETLWLNCTNEDAAGALFSLAGYAHDAQLRADQLAVPLFIIDLTGVPQPVNDAAERLIHTGPEA
jgi:DNA-directed RNA polymerase subunit RPC12/RpoP